MRTIPTLFNQTVVKFGSNTAFWEKSTNIYEPTSYIEMQNQSIYFAAGLKQLGIKKNDKIAILSQPRRDWVIAELGIFYLGAINVPLSTKLETADIIFRLNHSSTKILVISEFQLPKIATVLSSIPTLEKIILLDEKSSLATSEIAFAHVIDCGRKELDNNYHYITEEINNVKEEDEALISYTSGTTADPKGVVLTHKNLWVNSLQCDEFFTIKENYVSLLLLPLDHSFAHTALMYSIMRNGAALASVEQGNSIGDALRNLSTNIKEIKPDLLISVPALTKNFKKNIEIGIKNKGVIAELIFTIGIFLGNYYHGIGSNRGYGFRALAYFPYKLIDIIIFKKVRENFGGKLKYFVGGGAYLDIDLQKFFFSIGIPVYQGFGLTEASPVISANTPDVHKMGSSGKIVNYLDVKICDEHGNSLPTGQKGEIVVKGENVMKGYYLNPISTSETIKEQWLYTGDLGYFDKNNFLYVLGRFKSLLIANDGEKYSPEGIEASLTEHSTFIDQIILYNNQSNYTTAIIVPKKDVIRTWIKNHEHNVDEQNMYSLLIKEIEIDIAAYKANGKHKGLYPERWLPTTFILVNETFNEENKMVNSTLKMVRNKILEAYQSRINDMYTIEGKNPINSKNIDVLRNC